MFTPDPIQRHLELQQQQQRSDIDMTIEQIRAVMRRNQQRLDRLAGRSPFDRWCIPPATAIVERAEVLAASIIDLLGVDPLLHPEGMDPAVADVADDALDGAGFDLYLTADDPSVLGERTGPVGAFTLPELIVWLAWRRFDAPDDETRSVALARLASRGLPARAQSFAPRHVRRALELLPELYEVSSADVEPSVSAAAAQAYLVEFMGQARGLS